MLETIKFQTSTIKLISPYYNLGGPKLTTLYLVCDCKISSILVAFSIVSFYVVWILFFPLPGFNSLQYPDNAYFILFIDFKYDKKTDFSNKYTSFATRGAFS